MFSAIRILPVSRLFPFENDIPSRVDDYVRDLTASQKLRHPLLVHRTGDRMMVLDSASLYRALCACGATDVPVQFADSISLTLHAWHFALSGWHKEDMLHLCRYFPRKLVCRRIREENLDRSKTDICFARGERYRIEIRSNSIAGQVALIANLVESFSSAAHVIRGKFDTCATPETCGIPETEALVFPRIFTFEQINSLALGGCLFPPGLVRVDQPGRLFGLDFPLAVLTDTAPLREKESFLQELLRMRLTSDRVTYHYSPVYVLNH